MPKRKVLRAVMFDLDDFSLMSNFGYMVMYQRYLC